MDVNSVGSDWSFVPSAFGAPITSLQITLGATLGTYSGGIVLNGLVGVNATTWNVTISSSGGGGGSSPDSASSSQPAPVLQQFGKPVSGTCGAAAPTSLNWSGVASGGWGESWAQWMNSDNGGSLCTRTLIYSNALTKWVVA